MSTLGLTAAIGKHYCMAVARPVFIENDDDHLFMRCNVTKSHMAVIEQILTTRTILIARFTVHYGSPFDRGPSWSNRIGFSSLPPPHILETSLMSFTCAPVLCCIDSSKEPLGSMWTCGSAYTPETCCAASWA